LLKNSMLFNTLLEDQAVGKRGFPIRDAAKESALAGKAKGGRW
jgi:hypothetical protein